jgi:hypothetical protein
MKAEKENDMLSVEVIALEGEVRKGFEGWTRR